tara:strand:- start:140 stop:676 length:537 start_codon:yes stop_codon:yes gene_type:complete
MYGDYGYGIDFPELPLERLPDLPVLTQVKALYADPATKTAAWLGVVGGVAALAGPRLLKGKQGAMAKRLGTAAATLGAVLYAWSFVQAGKEEVEEAEDATAEGGEAAGFGAYGRRGGGRGRSRGRSRRRQQQQQQQQQDSGSSYQQDSSGGGGDEASVLRRVSRILKNAGYGGYGYGW